MVEAMLVIMHAVGTALAVSRVKWAVMVEEPLLIRPLLEEGSPLMQELSITSDRHPQGRNKSVVSWWKTSKQ